MSDLHGRIERSWTAGREPSWGEQRMKTARGPRRQVCDRDANDGGNRVEHARNVRWLVALASVRHRRQKWAVGLDKQAVDRHRANRAAERVGLWKCDDAGQRHVEPRSEEHTSELQSLRHLVCRLLLEKKKI